MAQYRSYPSLVRGAVFKYMKKHYERKEIKDLWEKTQKIYKSFLDESPDIGGKENNMSSNLYLALAVFAFYEAIDKKMTKEELRQMALESVPKNIPIISWIINFNNPRIQMLLRKRFEKYKVLSDSKLDNGEWGNNWRIEMNPHNREKGVAFDLIGCPLADFAKKHGYDDILPILCELDYRTASIMHAKLVREHTIAEGSEYCDYWYVGDKE